MMGWLGPSWVGCDQRGSCMVRRIARSRAAARRASSPESPAASMRRIARSVSVSLLVTSRLLSEMLEVLTITTRTGILREFLSRRRGWRACRGGGPGLLQDDEVSVQLLVHVAEQVDVVDKGTDDLDRGVDVLKALLIGPRVSVSRVAARAGDAFMAFPLSIWPLAIPIQVVAR